MAQPAEKSTHLPVLTPREILDLSDRRVRSYTERDRLYETYEKYYRGRQRNNQPSVLASNAQGRPLLRLSEDKGGESGGFSSQRLAPVVDDNAALVGRMPNSRVEPPDQSDQGLAKGELLSKFLISTHELSQMERQQADAGYHLSGLGDTCYLLETDPEIRRVTWTVVHPSTAYPAFMWGYRRFDVLDLVIRYYINPYQAKARWGFMPELEDDDKQAACVTLYISPYQRTILIGKERPERVAHVEWNLPFCPAVWAWNKVNGQFANSDIAQALVQQDALDFTWAVFLDGIVQNTYPMIAIKNPANVGQDPPQVGPGAPPIMLQDNGDLIVKNTQGDLSAITFGMQSLIGDIYAATGSSQVRQEGSIHASIQTGRLAHALQGPQATRVELKQQELGAAIQRANAMTLEMQEKAPFLGKHQFEIFGRYRGQSFREPMSGKDIDGWYRNTVFWEPVTGMNLQQKTAVAYEGMVAKLWDDLRAMELAGVEDPMGMRQRIASQLLHEAETQAKIQTTMGGAPGGAAPPGGEAPGGQGGGGGTPPATAGGGQPPTPPSPILRPPALAQMGGGGGALPTGVPQGVSKDAIGNLLAKVADKLKGTVFAVGELATNGQAMHVQLVTSDHRDHDLVLQTVRPLDPMVRVQTKKEGQMPPEAVRIA